MSLISPKIFGPLVISTLLLGAAVFKLKKHKQVRKDGEQMKFYEMERRDYRGLKERYVDWYEYEGDWDCSYEEANKEEEMYQ